jgi:excisionase family DNA binding protein
MVAVGNLNDFVKYQMARGMEQPGGAGAAGTASELAVGFAIAQQMMAQQGLPAKPAAGVGGPAAGAAGTDPGLALLSPAEAAQALGVTEADVMAVIASGELKAKKIGATYRIKRAAIDEYLGQD